jgi:hypothetical protein
LERDRSGGDDDVDRRIEAIEKRLIGLEQAMTDDPDENPTTCHDDQEIIDSLRDVLDVPWARTSEPGNPATYGCGVIGVLEYRVTYADHVDPPVAGAEALVGGDVVAQQLNHESPAIVCQSLLDEYRETILNAANTTDPSDLVDEFEPWASNDYDDDPPESGETLADDTWSAFDSLRGFANITDREFVEKSFKRTVEDIYREHQPPLFAATFPPYEREDGQRDHTFIAPRVPMQGEDWSDYEERPHLAPDSEIIAELSEIIHGDWYVEGDKYVCDSPRLTYRVPKDMIYANVEVKPDGEFKPQDPTVGQSLYVWTPGSPTARLRGLVHENHGTIQQKVGTIHPAEIEGDTDDE